MKVGLVMLPSWFTRTLDVLIVVVSSMHFNVTLLEHNVSKFTV